MMSSLPHSSDSGNAPLSGTFISGEHVAPRRGHFSVRFTVLGKAAPAGSKRAFVTKSGRAIVTDASAKTKPWQAEVRSAAVEAMMVGEEGGPHAGTLMPLLEGPLFLRVAFYEPRPKGHFNSKGELNVQGQRNPYPTKKPDLTKLLRAIEDGMTGVVWRDDSQVVHTIATKHYGEPARAEVQVARISLEGTWTNSKSIENSIA